MDSDGAVGDPSRRSLSWDSTDFDAFRYEWEARLGPGFPLTTFTQATKDAFRVKGRAVTVRDVALTDFRTAFPLRTAPAPDIDEDWVQMFVVRRGAWMIDSSSDHTVHTVSGGQFLLRHSGRQTTYETSSHISARTFVLPARELKPLVGARPGMGSTDTAEMRLLSAHAHMVHTIADLGPAGVQAAWSTLIELAKAVAMRRLDVVEPQLAPALAQAAKNLANSHLADPELSPTMLARELSVSVRTLQRAFAVTGESVTAYIRHRRLEAARTALIAPAGRLSVSELAAHWQFADSSHFIRAFKNRYGETPAEYARSATAHEAGGPRRGM